jgi:NADP-dependent 3-hydroxy acid dehydrogenase YdfG
MHNSQDVAIAGLSDAVVIVTGAGSGIGAATARKLGAAGAAAVLVGRRTDPLREVAAEITAAGGQALCVPADLADPASAGRITQACLAGSTAWSTTRP